MAVLGKCHGMDGLAVTEVSINRGTGVRSKPSLVYSVHAIEENSTINHGTGWAGADWLWSVAGRSCRYISVRPNDL